MIGIIAIQKKLKLLKIGRIFALKVYDLIKQNASSVKRGELNCVKPWMLIFVRECYMLQRLCRKKGFFIQLNSILNGHDAVANDVLYHLKCWVNTQRNVSKMEDKDNDIEQTEDLTRILADIDIINMVKNISKENPEEFMTMSEINEEYNRLMNNENLVNYKLYIKQLLPDNVDSISFNRPKV